MDKQLMADTPAQHREPFLRDSCYKVLEDETYTRRLESEEVAEMKTALYERVKKIISLTEELKQITKNFKDEIKVLEFEKQDLVQSIQFESVSERGTLYAMDDQDNGLMGFYDKTGELVFTRPLKPEERQTSILTIKRNGTND